MATVFRRGSTWVVKWRDGAGRWRQRRTTCETKLEAKELARELDRQAEFHREGLTPIERRKTMQFAEVLDWYIENVAGASRSDSMKKDLNRYVRPALGSLTVQEVTSAKLENFLDGLAAKPPEREGLAPKSINNVRASLNAVFVRARRRGVWTGPNPVEGVERRDVPKRVPAFLKADEVQPVLENVPPQWRAFFAAAVYTGMRRGELAALQKSDVDLEAGTLTVSRSWDSDTTKGGRACTLPIHPELKPYLAEAIRKSPSRLVFPRDDGKMQREHLDLSPILRTAMTAAHIVDSWVHKCRRPGCKNSVKSETDKPIDCPKDGCGWRMWAVAQVRPIRFHDLRHTTATLMLKAGVSLAVVQRVLRHSSPLVTSEVYGHLDLDDMRAGLERLSFTTSTAPEALAEVLPIAANSQLRGAPVVRNLQSSETSSTTRAEITSDSAHFNAWALQDSNLQPSGYEPVTSGSDGLAGARTGSHALGRTGNGAGRALGRSGPFRTGSTLRGAPVVRNVVRLLRVREVAEALAVCTATVYALIDRGELERVWVKNSIRVPAESLEAFALRGRG